jgi:hypothetical protein
MNLYCCVHHMLHASPDSRSSRMRPEYDRNNLVLLFSCCVLLQPPSPTAPYCNVVLLALCLKSIFSACVPHLVWARTQAVNAGLV